MFSFVLRLRYEYDGYFLDELLPHSLLLPSACRTTAMMFAKARKICGVKGGSELPAPAARESLYTVRSSGSVRLERHSTSEDTPSPPPKRSRHDRGTSDAMWCNELLGATSSEPVPNGSTSAHVSSEPLSPSQDPGVYTPGKIPPQKKSSKVCIYPQLPDLFDSHIISHRPNASRSGSLCSIPS